MKKIIIPTILAATILVAGMFAMMPIQKASTIHSTFTGGVSTNSVQPRTITVAATEGAASDVTTITCPGDPFVASITIAGTPADGTYDISVAGTVVVDDAPSATADNFVVGAAAGANVVVTYTAGVTAGEANNIGVTILTQGDSTAGCTATAA